MTGLEPGSALGEFVIEAVAGRGGMGVVYRARQLRPERTVALKVIAPELASDSGFRERFERESQIAAQIEHPNVIPVYSVGEDGGVLFIAMRFVDGTDLRTLLVGEGRLAPERAATIVDQVAQALDAAHARGLVHRDVKPANVLIAGGGGREHAYLTDFGLSRHVESNEGMTATGAFVGTIDYVAPEQVRGEPVDARTDVYSLGCVLFHVLTGTVPFPLGNDIAKLFAHGSELPPPARSRLPELSPAFDEVLERAMAKDPGDRFPSAGDLGRAALAAAGDEPLPRAERSVGRGSAAPAEGLAKEHGARGATAGAGAGNGPPEDAATRRAATAEPPPARRRPLLLAGAAVAIAAVAVTAALLLGGGDGDAGDGGAADGASARKDAAAVPSGARLVAKRDLRTKSSLRYTVALSVPRDAGGGAAAPVPLTMSLLAARGTAPLKVIQRERLPSPPYRFAKNSYVSEFTLDPAPDDAASVDLSWFVHPGDNNTVTCYFSISLGGFSLNSCS